MQLDTFADERMKILYALSFMCGGIAQVWVENKTNAVLSHTSTFSTLAKLLAGITRTFGDPDQEGTAHAQLHTLKMTTGMMADEYMAKFEMLAGRTVSGFTPCKVISSELRSYLPSQTYVIQPIPRLDSHACSIPVSDSTWGCSSEQ